jgi:SAM-dependent methyltransferase
MVTGMKSEPVSDTARRLRAEADAQNARVLRQKSEPRDKFYFLIERAFQKYNSAIGAVDGRRVLVAGCSEGGVTAMARNGAVVTGIDIADEAIRRLGEALEKAGLSGRANALVMNAEQLDFPPQTFDLIVCTGVLHHLDIPRAAASWARALKPNGRVVMIEPMAWSPAASVYRAVTPSMRTADEHPLKPNDVRTLETHFANVAVESFALTSTASVVWAVLPDVFSLKLRWRDWLERLDRSLMTRFPSLRYFAWTAVIECACPRVQAAREGQIVQPDNATDPN